MPCGPLRGPSLSIGYGISFVPMCHRARHFVATPCRVPLASTHRKSRRVASNCLEFHYPPAIMRSPGHSPAAGSHRPHRRPASGAGSSGLSTFSEASSRPQSLRGGRMWIYSSTFLAE